MTTKVPFRISEIDINNICYTDVKSNEKKTIVYLKYMDNNKLKNIVFQTPTTMSSNMIQCKNNIFELDVPLVGKEIDKINRFIQFLEALDKKIVKDAKNNNKWFELFSNQKTMKYQKILRESTDGNRNGVVRLKLLRTNDFETIVQYNNSRINIEEIQKDCWLKSILEIYAIWINENGFGLFIRPILLSFKPCMKINYNYKLIEDSEDVEDVAVDTVYDNSIFLKSESDITSSILEMPKTQSSENDSEQTFEEVEKDDSSDGSSDDEVEEERKVDLNSSTSSDD
jgi:hypothetical protein